MVTSKDVARLAGVSQSTVSYVMSGKRPISPEVRRRVQDAMAQVGFQPNAGARALAGRRTSVIGLVAPSGPTADPTGLLPFIATIATGVREHDFDLLLVTADEGPSALTRLEGRRLCDAIVLMEIEARDPRLDVAAELRVPVVLIGVPDEPRGLPCVDVDFAEAARLVVTELAATGHARAVVVGYPPETVGRDINYVRRFLDSARATAHGVGLPLDVVSPVDPSAEGAGRAVAAADLGRPGTTGVVVAATSAVQPVLTALAAAGHHPGRDVTVVGVCTDAAAAASTPAVSNVSLEPRDVSRLALRTIFRLLDAEGAAPPAGVALVTPRLTHRSTTARAALPAA